MKNTDKLVTKSGKVMTVADYQKFISKQKKDTKKLRVALTRDFIRLRMDNISEEDAIKQVAKKREVSETVVKNAVTKISDEFGAKTQVEIEAKAMVLQDREEQAMNELVFTLDYIINDILSHPEDHMFTVSEKVGLRGDETKQLPRNEYLIYMMERKRKAIKETLDSTKVFKNKGDMNVVVISPEDRAKRFSAGLDKFGVEVAINKVEDINHEEVGESIESGDTD